MSKNAPVIFLSLFFLSLTVSAQNQAKEIFAKYGVKGSTTIYDYKHKKWFYSDDKDALLPMQPASTFKVINLLVGLETKAITDENEVIKWPGKTDTLLYGYRPEIYTDMTIKEAFEVSAGWAFIEMAKRIDRKTYFSYLKKSGYGNLDLSEKGDDFWNFGPMKISPKNQVEFLVKMYEEKVPFLKRNVEILKSVMITKKTDQLILRSKTGWTRMDQKDIGWWVGYVETRDNVYFFATRIFKLFEDNHPNFGSMRKDITKEIFHNVYQLDL